MHFLGLVVFKTMSIVHGFYAFPHEGLLITILCFVFTSKVYASVETRNLITIALVVVKMLYPESSLDTITMSLIYILFPDTVE